MEGQVVTEDEKIKLYVALERRWKVMSDLPDRQKEYVWIDYLIEMGMWFSPDRHHEGMIHVRNPADLGGAGLLYVCMTPELAEKILVLGGIP